MDRKIREEHLHKRLAKGYEEGREGTKIGKYYSKEWLRFYAAHSKHTKKFKHS